MKLKRLYRVYYRPTDKSQKTIQSTIKEAVVISDMDKEDVEAWLKRIHTDWKEIVNIDFFANTSRVIITDNG